MINSVLSTFDVGLDGNTRGKWRELSRRLFQLPELKPSNKRVLSEWSTLFTRLGEIGVDVKTYQPSPRSVKKEMRHLEKEIEQADIIFHYGGRMQNPSSTAKGLSTEINRLIRGRYLYKAHTVSQDKRLITKRMEDAGIPVPETMDAVEYLASGQEDSVVLKRRHSSLGLGVLYLNREQVQRFFDRESWKGILPWKGILVNPPRPKDYIVQPFIETPGDSFTSYRIFTVGGEILGCVLQASDKTKADTIRGVKWEKGKYQYLADMFGTYPIVSNFGIQTPVWPVMSPLTISQYGILENHLIDPSKLGEEWPLSGPAALLYNLSTLAGRALTEYGIIIAGQDWIQDTKGNLYFLEANPLPALRIFKTLFLQVSATPEECRNYACGQIADALKRYEVRPSPTETI